MSELTVDALAERLKSVLAANPNVRSEALESLAAITQEIEQFAVEQAALPNAPTVRPAGAALRLPRSELWARVRLTRCSFSPRWPLRC